MEEHGKIMLLIEQNTRPPPIPQIDFKLLARQTEVNKIKINNNFFYQKVLEKIKNVLNFYI